jgi:hypothetical protein
MVPVSITVPAPAQVNRGVFHGTSRGPFVDLIHPGHVKTLCLCDGSDRLFLIDSCPEMKTVRHPPELGQYDLASRYSTICDVAREIKWK